MFCRKIFYHTSLDGSQTIEFFLKLIYKMPGLIPLIQLTHKQRVLRLYKRILRNLESYYYHRPVFRYQATLMRDRFDQNISASEEEGAKLLCEAENELFKKEHYHVKQFPRTIGGSAYGRDPHIPDWVLDYWHPLEKAQYPEYFSRREQRKKEYIEMWERQYGSCSSSNNGH